MSISSEKINQIIELRKSGKTYEEIRKITGCCKNTCIKYLKETDIYLKKEIVEITPELLAKIQERYNLVGSIKKIAKEFNISACRLRKAGLQVNKPIKSQEDFCRQTSYYKKVKEKLVQYKGGKCLICGYNKCITALEFHHLDPSGKDFTISGGTKSFERAKSEVDKCILVCANCHREIHTGLL